MFDRLRLQSATVGVIYVPQRGFLLRSNPEWRKLAFIMKKVAAVQDAEELALIGVDDGLNLKFRVVSARPIDWLGAFGVLGRTGHDTYYDYSAFQLELGEARSGSACADEAYYFTFERWQAADNVTWSTKTIGRALVDSPKIVAAVLTRPGELGPECLLVRASNYGYSCPSVARRVNDTPESLSQLAIQVDTGYTGPIAAKRFGEVEFIRSSQWIGYRSVQFRCHICRVDLFDCDLLAGDNPFDRALQAKAAQETTLDRQHAPFGYGHWYPLAQLDTEPNFSPTTASIHAALRRAAESSAS